MAPRPPDQCEEPDQLDFVREPPARVPAEESSHPTRQVFHRLSEVKAWQAEKGGRRRRTFKKPIKLVDRDQAHISPMSSLSAPCGGYEMIHRHARLVHEAEPGRESPGEQFVVVSRYTPATRPDAQILPVETQLEESVF